MLEKRLMKKRFFIYSVVCSFMLSFVDLSADPGDDPIPIKIEESQPDPDDPNRAPAIIPVNCCFNYASGILYFSFLFPMNDVTITLTEAVAGVVSTDDYSTSSCFVAVPVPGPGMYDISILLESETEYTGQFVYL